MRAREEFSADMKTKSLHETALRMRNWKSTLFFRLLQIQHPSSHPTRTF
jgi:hypothetical protein